MHHGMPPDGRNRTRGVAGPGVPGRGGVLRGGYATRGSPPGARSDEDDEDEDDDEEDNAGAIDVDAVKGADRARDRLIPWLRRITESVEEEQNPILITLCEVTASSGAQEVTTLEHGQESDIEETVDQLIASAVDDIMGAQFRGSKQSYAIVVRLQSGDTKRYTFVLEIPRPQSALVDPPRRQHFPDPNGVVGMFMNQNLQLTQYALEGASTGKDILLEMNRELKEENRFLRRTQFQRDREMQILLDGNLKRQMLVDEHRAKVERDAKIGEGFKALAPALLALALPPHLAQTLQTLAGSGLGGGGVGPQAEPGALALGSSPEADLIDELIRELEDDQEFFLKLFNLMGEKPSCVQIFGTLYQTSQARRKARAEQQAAEAARRQDAA